MTETREDTQTDRRSSGERSRADRPRTARTTLGDVDHTHPTTGRSFGGTFTFARGGVIAADGGRPDVVPENGDEDDGAEAADEDDEPQTLKDVEHTPPNESEDANRVFERGEEARADDVDEEARDEDAGEDE